MKAQQVIETYGKLAKNEAEEPTLEQKILDFFKAQTEAPKDSVIHKFAEDNKIAPDQLEAAIYKILFDKLKG